MVGSGDYSRDRFGQEEVHARGGGNLYIMLAVAYCMLLLPWFGEYIFVTKSCTNTPPDPKRVATLPCEI